MPGRIHIDSMRKGRLRTIGMWRFYFVVYLLLTIVPTCLAELSNEEIIDLENELLAKCKCALIILRDDHNVKVLVQSTWQKYFHFSAIVNSRNMILGTLDHYQIIEQLQNENRLLEKTAEQLKLPSFRNRCSDNGLQFEMEDLK